MRDRKQFLAGPLARALVLALMVLGCAKREDEQVVTSGAASNGSAVGEKRDSPTVGEGQKPVRVSVFSHTFDRECGLLSITVEFFNPSNKPVFLVATDFAFLGGPDTDAHILRIDQRSDEWVLDLSYPMLTAEGVNAVLGGLHVFPVIELEPGDPRYITYVFRFPLRLDCTYSETGFEEPIELPQGRVRIALRFGYGREKPWDFVERIKQQPSALEAFRQIVEHWQTLVSSSPIVIDNSPEPDASTP